jgi:hypothetical protein
MRFLVFRTFTLAILLFAAVPVFGQTEIAKYGGEFMATGFGGRALAMGGAHVAIANDVTAAYWNPAGLMRMSYPEIGLMHEQRFGGLLSYNYGGVAWPFGDRSTVALTVTRLGVDDIPDTRNALIDLNGNGQLDPNERLDPSRITMFSTADWVAYASFAFRGADALSLGVNLKFIHRAHHIESATGVGFDVGAQYAVNDQFFLGAAVQDVTTTLMAWSTGRNELVSPTLKLGAAYQLHVLGGTITPAVDFDFMAENRRYASTFNVGAISVNPRAGLEYRFQNLFSIRGGYSDTQDLTFGAGIHLPKLYLDYAFGQNDLFSEFKDASHRISLRLVLEEAQFARTE